VKSMNNRSARRVRLRSVVAYPALSIALVASVALVMTPFGPGQGIALAASPTPTGSATSPATATPTSSPPTSSPSSTVVATPSSTSTPTPATTPAPTPGPGPSVTAVPGSAPLDHHVLARIEGTDLQPRYLAVDAAVRDASQFQTFRVRFQLHNAGTVPITATPRLEYRPVGGAGFVVVPEAPKQGIAFRVAREWVPSLGLGGGTKQGPLGETIAVGDRRIGTEVGKAVSGHHSMGANPDRPVTLPPASYTEQEFTVQLTTDAKYLSGYELRITNLGAALTGTQVARIDLGSPPLSRLSPGQRRGVRVDGPKRTNAAGVAYPLMSGPLKVAGTTSVKAVGTTSVKAVPAVYRLNAPRYVLASGSLSPATIAPSAPATIAPSAPATIAPSAPATVAPSAPATIAPSTPATVVPSTPATVAPVASAAGTPAGIHGPYSLTTDKCAVCHRAHAAKAPNLLAKPGSQSALCFTCHGNAPGASTNVQAQYELQRPANNAAAREYYSHDAVDSTPAIPHTQSKLDEFGGVSNRHSECADCHNSHKASDATDSAPTLDTDVGGGGWNASGRLAGVSGVSVVNGAAGTAPTYKFLNGVTDPVTREYQLCFKCHSGATTLTDNAGLKLTQFALDKGVEFNPNNASFHPVEAAGTNKTAKMQASLDGLSPYKLWNFTTNSTIRCLNCHASGTTPDTTPTPKPAAGASLPPHTSSNRGILLKNYQDRELKPQGDGLTLPSAYSAGDFALCYVCHSEAPFAPGGSTEATNFPYHSKHLTDINGRGDAGTDINTPGAGGGNAICAECHFRIHSTTDKVGAQVVPGSRLVNFAPNVEANGATLSWTPGVTGGGSCAVTCHGYSHNRSYGP
jgi:predicted CXXCH cytochrome family protein